MSQTNSRPAAGRLPHKTAVKLPPLPEKLEQNQCVRLISTGLLLCLFLLTSPASVAAQTVTARLSVDVLSLDEGDDSTSITVTASLSQAASAATTITLALPTTRPTSPFLLPGMTIATQGASNDYTTTFDATTHTITIAANQTSGTTTFNIDPSTDKIIDEDDETIIITGTGTGLSVLPTEVYLEDGPYVAFPSMINAQVFYPTNSVNITVPEVTDKYDTTNSQITYTHTVTPTTAYGLSFDNATRTLSGTLNSAATAGTTIRYTITATDDMGTTTGTNPTDDDKTATTIVSVNVIQDQCSTPTGWHPDGVTPTAALIKDCNILLAAKASFEASGSTGTLDWTTTDKLSSWSYVNTLPDLDHSRVESLFVDRASYAKGPIPPALGGLTELKDLTFQRTKDLNGTIPPELGSLSALKWLTLNDNKLTGTVPRELGGLANLTSLGLALNQLSGSIPDELGQLTKLNTLDLLDNQLSGSLPWELGKLSEMVYFLLHKNTFSGIIPPRFDRMTKLISLALYDNPFTPGPIPYLPTSLERIFLNNTNRTGPLPQRLSELTKLEGLTLRDNALSGAIPEDLGKLTKLKDLFLRNNNLSGAIPAKWGSATHTLPSLEVFDLRNNNLSGTIPASLGNLGKDGTTRNLDWLLLSGNQLTGSIPADLNKLAGLGALFLHNNLLTGELPAAFDANTNLDGLIAFRFDYNESVCLPATLKQWYDDLPITNKTFQDTVEAYCSFDSPAAPTTVTPGPASLAMSWGAYSSTHTAPPTFTLSDYQFQYRAGTTGKWLTVAPTVAAPITGATLIKLAPAQSYQVRYRARAAHATDTDRFYGTKWSQAASATVLAATLSAYFARTTATLAIDKWPHEWWYKGSQTNATCTAVAAGTAGADLTGLTASTAYTYTAHRDEDCSTATQMDTVTFTTVATEPPAPTVTSTLTAAPTGGQLTVTGMTAPANFTADSYEVRYRQCPTAQCTNTAVWLPVPGKSIKADATPLTVAFTTELAPGKYYKVRYRALDEDDSDSSIYTASSWSAASTAVLVPAVTLSVHYAQTTATLAIDKWPHQWWYKGNQTGATCTAVPAGTTGVDLTSLTANTAYTYTAYRDKDCSTATEMDDVSFTTLTTDVTAPTAPTLTAAATGGKLTATWSAYAANNFTASHYEVRYGQCTTSQCTDTPTWLPLPGKIVTTLTTDFTTELTPGISYKVRYRALDVDDSDTSIYAASPWSTASTAVLVPAATLTPSATTTTGVTLTLDKWPHEWWYKGSQTDAACTKVDADTSGTSTVHAQRPDPQYLLHLHRLQG